MSSFHDLSLVMLRDADRVGWANLILDRERRYIAMLPPPIAEALKDHVPLADSSAVRNGGDEQQPRRQPDDGVRSNVETEGEDHV